MVVYGCHEEKPFPSEFEKGDLQKDRPEFKEENEPDDGEKKARFGKNEHDADQAPQAYSPRIAHDYGRWRSIKPKVGEKNTNNRSDQRQQFLDAGNVGNQQVAAPGGVARNKRNDPEKDEAGYNRNRGQGVEPIRKIDPIREDRYSNSHEWYENPYRKIGKFFNDAEKRNRYGSIDIRDVLIS